MDSKPLIATLVCLLISIHCNKNWLLWRVLEKWMKHDETGSWVLTMSNFIFLHGLQQPSRTGTHGHPGSYFSPNSLQLVLVFTDVLWFKQTWTIMDHHGPMIHLLYLIVTVYCLYPELLGWKRSRGWNSRCSSIWRLDEQFTIFRDKL